MTAKFTSSNVQALQDEMVEVLNRYGFKNIEFSGNTRSYGSHETTFKIVGNIAGTQSESTQELEWHCKQDGIDPTQKGAKGEELLEYHTRKHTYPYIWKTISGKRYKGNADMWKNKL